MRIFGIYCFNKIYQNHTNRFFLFRCESMREIDGEREKESWSEMKRENVGKRIRDSDTRRIEEEKSRCPYNLHDEP